MQFRLSQKAKLPFCALWRIRSCFKYCKGKICCLIYYGGHILLLDIPRIAKFAVWYTTHCKCAVFIYNGGQICCLIYHGGQICCLIYHRGQIYCFVYHHGGQNFAVWYTLEGKFAVRLSRRVNLLFHLACCFIYHEGKISCFIYHGGLVFFVSQIAEDGGIMQSPETWWTIDVLQLNSDCYALKALETPKWNNNITLHSK